MYHWQNVWWSQYVTPWYQAERRPHAVMLNGQAGTGLEQFAHAFARTVLCEQQTDDTACGQCHACRLFDAENHPDYLVLQPEGTSETITVDTVRAVAPWIAQTAHQSGYQVVLVTPVYALNQAASNALLKSLEEPMGSVLYLLVNPGQRFVLPTIRSRTQVWTMPPVSEEQAQPFLQSALSVSAADMTVLWRYAEGAPLRAVTYAAEGYLTLCQEMAAVLYDVATGQADPLEVCQSWQSYDVKTVVSLWMDFVRRCLTTKEQGMESASAREVAWAQVDRPVLFQVYAELQRARSICHSQVACHMEMLLQNLLLGWRARFLGVLS